MSIGTLSGLVSAKAHALSLSKALDNAVCLLSLVP